MPSDHIDELLHTAAEGRSIDELANAGSWSSYHQFRRLLEERARLETSSLYEQADLLAEWLRNWDLVPGHSVVRLPRGTCWLPDLSSIRWCRSDGMRRPRWDPTSGPSGSGSRTASPRSRSSVTSRPLSTHWSPRSSTSRLARSSKRSASAGVTPACLFRLRWQHHDTDASEGGSVPDAGRAVRGPAGTDPGHDHRPGLQRALRGRPPGIRQLRPADRRRCRWCVVGPRGPRRDRPARSTSRGSPSRRPRSIADDLLAGDARIRQGSSPSTWPRPAVTTASWPSTRAAASSPRCRRPPSRPTPGWPPPPSTPLTPSRTPGTRPRRPRSCWNWPRR